MSTNRTNYEKRKASTQSSKRKCTRNPFNNHHSRDIRILPDLPRVPWSSRNNERRSNDVLLYATHAGDSLDLHEFYSIIGW